MYKVSPCNRYDHVLILHNVHTALLAGSNLAFLVSNKTAFELPLEKISNSNMAGRNEVSLEFALSQPPPGGKKSREDELTEIRLFVPNTYVRDVEEGGKMDIDEEMNAAQVFHDMIKEKAEIGQVTGERIALFADVNVTTPRCARQHILSFKPLIIFITEDALTLTCSKISSGCEGRCTTTRSSILPLPVFSYYPNRTMSTSHLWYVLSSCQELAL